MESTVGGQIFLKISESLPSLCPMEWPDKSVSMLPHIAARVERGFGCGSRSTYRGWEDFRTRSNKGSARNFECSLTGRRVDLPSAAHLAYFFLQERRSAVRSIEQCFPFLDIAESLAICAEFGLVHQAKGLRPEPYTLDFLLRESAQDGSTRFQGRTLSSSDAGPGAFSELDVIQELCKRHGVTWRIVPLAPLQDATLLDSLLFARAWIRERFDPDRSGDDEFPSKFLEVHRGGLTLKECLEAVVRRTGGSLGRATSIFRHAVWTGRIDVDFTKELSLRAPVELLTGDRHGLHSER